MTDDESARLTAVRWHIDRYDRLRASTASRAAVFMSANALLLTGITVLLNYAIKSLDGRALFAIFFWIALALAVVSILSSISFCTRALVTVKTSRRLFDPSIPDRGAFHWGDASKSFPKAHSFVASYIVADPKDELPHALAELWTDIQQHKKRYTNLRRASTFFQFGIVGVLVVVAFTVFAQI